MKHLQHPLWILITAIIPQIILFSLYYSSYQIIQSLLKPENIEMWWAFGIPLGVAFLGNIGYLGYLLRQKKEVRTWYGFGALAFYIPFAYLFLWYSNKIIPWRIPRWMMDNGELTLYMITFLMPVLFYALLLVIQHFTPKEKTSSAVPSFGMVVAIPLCFYFVTTVIEPLLYKWNLNFADRYFPIVLVLGVLLFLFFLLRFFYILTLNNNAFWQRTRLFWLVLIGIVFPLAGLLLNNGIIPTFEEEIFKQIFGDFSHWSFYALAVGNGILLCLPNTQKALPRLGLFFARSITYSFILYFFVVFLPFLPVSIVAILAMGLGFLILAPLLITFLQTRMMSEDFDFLKNHYSPTLLKGVLLLGVLVLPSIIFATYHNDRQQLHLALDHVYAPDYSLEQAQFVNTNAIKRTLNTVKSHKNNRNNIELTNRKPYLSTFYKWYVLDNLTLSDKKIATLERTFLGAFDPNDFPSSNNRRGPNRGNIELTNLSVNSQYDFQQDCWKSQVDLVLQNNEARQREYATEFNLPDGAWISDYYLWIGDRKEPGLLTEKKAAMWVYRQITSRRKDPGILYYTNNNQLAFKVFPFNALEERKTGFEILHKHPFTFEIDGQTVVLGKKSTAAEYNDMNRMKTTQAPQTVPTKAMDGNALYFSADYKQSLQAITRTPYYHFIVDCSAKQAAQPKEMTKLIQSFLAQYPQQEAPPKITFANYTSQTQTMDNNWQQALANFPKTGGFHITRAIKQVLYQNYVNPSKNYPHIIVVTDNYLNSIQDDDLSNWQFTLPDISFYHLLETATDIPQYQSLWLSPFEGFSATIPNDTIVAPIAVIPWPSAEHVQVYLPNNKKSTLAYLPNNFPSLPVNKSHFTKGNYQAGLDLQATHLHHILHPNKAETEWLKSIQGSFKTGIMTPLTSYMVVENEAQKAALLKKQDQVLNAKKSLDTLEELPRMSEPTFWWMLLGLLLFLWVQRRRERCLL